MLVTLDKKGVGIIIFNIKWIVQKKLILKIVRTTISLTWSIKHLDPNKIKIDEKVIQKYSYLKHWICKGQRS